jgi:hypothetical protein
MILNCEKSVSSLHHRPKTDAAFPEHSARSNSQQSSYFLTFFSVEKLESTYNLTSNAWGVAFFTSKELTDLLGVFGTGNDSVRKNHYYHVSLRTAVTDPHKSESVGERSRSIKFFTLQQTVV